MPMQKEQHQRVCKANRNKERIPHTTVEEPEAGCA